VALGLLMASKLLNVQVGVLCRLGGWRLAVAGGRKAAGWAEAAGARTASRLAGVFASFACTPPLHLSHASPSRLTAAAAASAAALACPWALQVPFLLKYTIDSLTADPTALTPATVAGVLALTPPALIVGYGVARAGATLCNELRNAVFAQARDAHQCTPLSSCR
jgi:uncharacterized membrane protein